MIVIAHKERCEYLLDNGIKIGADALSGGCYTDTGDKSTSKMPQTYEWNEDPFIWFKYPLYSYCRANAVWNKNIIEEVKGVNNLFIPTDKDEYLLFVTPKIDSNRYHKQKPLSAGKYEIIIDTILKPMYLIKLPDKDKREFAEIKKSIETILKECKEAEFPQKKEIIKSLEYIIKNFDYLKKRHFPTKEMGTKYDKNIHPGRVYLTVCDPRDSYLNKDCIECTNSEEGTEIISDFAGRRSVPIKCCLEEADNKKIIQKVKEILESNYQKNFVRFDNVFDNQSVNEFKEMRKNAKLVNKINF